MIIAVDSGKSNTKAISKQGELFFKTKISDDQDFKMNLSNTFNVEYQNKIYLIGDDAASIDYDTDKAKLLHKLCIYLSAHKITNCESINIITGCPIIQYLEKNYRDKYKSYLYGNGYIEITVDGIYKRIKINDIHIMPESVGYVMNNPSACLNRLTAVIDIGGLNTNGAIYERLKPIKESTFTINQGGNILHNKLKRELNSQLGLNYQDYEMAYVINDTNEDIKKITNGILQNQMNLIIEECKKNNWNLSKLDVIFTGGGSLIYGKIIKTLLPNAIISSNPVWDNVKGFYKMGELLCH